jgi:hypothetical protein
MKLGLSLRRINVPTTEQKDAATASIESLLSGSFRPEGAWTRPSDGVDGVPWNSLTDEQKFDVLSASVDWQGFDAGQIVDVSRRVVEGESIEFWFDDIPVSDRAERTEGLFEEWRQDEQAARERDGLGDKEIDPRFLNEDGTVSDRTTLGFVEYEMAELRSYYFDDGADPMVDHWPSLQEAEKLRLINRHTSLKELAEEDAGLFLQKHVYSEYFTREALLSETYSLTREIGFVGFRREFVGDADTIREWPDPADREKGIREAWDEIADFATYRHSHADVEIEMLTHHRDLLLTLRSGPEDAQVEFYRSAGAMGEDLRLAANDNEPAWRSEFNSMMRDIANPPRLDEWSYQVAIQRAADSATTDQPDKDRGPER